MADDVLEKVLQVFGEVFRNKGLPVPAMSRRRHWMESLGLESLDFAAVVVRLEEIFNFNPFADGVPASLRTVRGSLHLYQ